MIRRCCCKCEIGRDEFNRADSDSPGASWSERSGDADIVGNQLQFITAGLVRFETAHPGGTSGKQFIEVQFDLDSASSYARGVVSYVDDSTYLYAGVEQVSGCWVLRLRKVAGGSDTAFGSTPDFPIGVTTAGLHTFQVCWDPTINRLSARIPGFGGISSTGGGATDGDKVGLAGSANVIFDNFVFEKLQDESNTVCPHCKTECLVANDYFDRGPDTDVGCGWEEVSGTWGITAGGQLEQTAAGAAIIKRRNYHPDQEFNHYVEVDVVLPVQVPSAVANQARVLVNYDPLLGNYHYAQFSLDSAGVTGTLTVGKSGGASDSVGASWTAGTYRLVVCWDDTNQVLTASVQRPGATIGRSLSSTRVANGMYVGLAAGSGSTGNEKFDNFEFWKHFSAAEPDCPDCPEFSSATPCTTCCTTPAAAGSYKADLGASALSNDCCTDCGTIAGEYLLAQVQGACIWRYRADLCAGACAGFGIELVINSVVGGCQWQLTVTLDDAPFGSSRCGCTPPSPHGFTVVYKSAIFPSTECQVLPRTLTKVSASYSASGDPLCTGTLPDTITLE